MLLERSKQGLAGPDIANNGNTRCLPEIPVTIKTFAARGGSLPCNDYQLVLFQTRSITSKSGGNKAIIVINVVTTVPLSCIEHQ